MIKFRTSSGMVRNFIIQHSSFIILYEVPLLRNG